MKASKFRHVFTLVLLVLVAAVAAGCGDDNDTASTESAAVTGATGDAAMKEKEAMKKEAAMKEDAAMKKEKAMKQEDAAMSAKAATVKIGDTQFGEILQDKEGRTLYLFTKEKGSKSECYDDCAVAWPPLITKSDPKAGSGAKSDLLGTTKRSDGKLQVTYNGHPLYYYVDEDEPNEVLCQAVAEFGGTWYVVDAKGNAITKS